MKKTIIWFFLLLTILCCHICVWAQLEFCHILILSHFGFELFLSFAKIWAMSQLDLYPNLGAVTIFILFNKYFCNNIGFVTICFCHNLCFITKCVSSQCVNLVATYFFFILVYYLFCHNLCFITIYFSSQFVFITICFS